MAQLRETLNAGKVTFHEALKKAGARSLEDLFSTKRSILQKLNIHRLFALLKSRKCGSWA
jgi:hypothetical protein